MLSLCLDWFSPESCSWGRPFAIITAVHKRLLVLIIVLLLVLVGSGAYLFFHTQILSWIDQVTGANKGSSEQSSQEVTCPAQTFTNTRQGYSVCYPKGWYTRNFDPSQLNVGFDAFPIPKASEYPGVFAISVSRQSSATLLASYLNDLKNTSTTTVTVGGDSAIKVQGIFPSDDMFFSNYHQVAVVLEKFGRTYSIVLLSSPDGYTANLPLYDTFVASLRFLDGTLAAPWGKDIFLDTPWPGDKVSSSFHVSGSAQGAFENTIVVRLKTADGKVLLQTPIVYSAPGADGLGYFDTPVTFSTSSSEGTLEVYYTSPKDGSIVDLVSVPLKFK